MKNTSDQLRLSLALPIVFVLSIALAPGVASAQRWKSQSLPVLAAAHTTVAVNDSGDVAALSPTDRGTWLVLARGSRTPGARAIRKTFVAGRFLRYPSLFPDGRLGAEDTGSPDEDFPSQTVLLDPETGKVLWEASLPGHHAFSSTGATTVWMPCYYCASTDAENAAARVARQFMHRGLTIAVEDTTSDTAARTLSFGGAGFDWSSVSEVIGTAAYPLDNSASQVLVIWNGIPWLVEDGHIRMMPVADLAGPVRNVAVSPDGNIAVFGFDLGIFRAFDIRSGQQVWVAGGDSSTFREFAVSRLGVTVGKASSSAIVHPVGRDDAVFELPSGVVVRYSFSKGRTTAQLDLGVQDRPHTDNAPRPLATSVSPKGRYVAVVNRETGELELHRFDTVHTTS